LVFAVLQLIFFPLLDKRKRLEKTITIREREVKEMQAMQQKYGQLHVQSNNLEKQLGKRAAGFSLFSFLEKMATQAKVKEHIAYMKPSSVTGEGLLRQVMVEMKLRTIGLKQLVAFLEHMESPENVVTVKRISIQENKKTKGTLDVIIQVISIDRQGAK
jgi:general secretion pathway protein M